MFCMDSSARDGGNTMNKITPTRTTSNMNNRGQTTVLCKGLLKSGHSPFVAPEIRGLSPITPAVGLAAGEIQTPLAQLVDSNPEFSSYLGLGLVTQTRQPYRLKFEFPCVVPAFLAFHGIPLSELVCPLQTVHQTWVGSGQPDFWHTGSRCR